MAKPIERKSRTRGFFLIDPNGLYDAVQIAEALGRRHSETLQAHLDELLRCAGRQPIRGLGRRKLYLGSAILAALEKASFRDDVPGDPACDCSFKRSAVQGEHHEDRTSPVVEDQAVSH